MASGKQSKGQQHAGQPNKGATHPGQGAKTSAAQAAANAKLAKQLNSPNETKDLKAAEAAIEKALAKLGLADDVNFSRNARGLVVSILTDKVLFPTDSADLQPQGVLIINAIAPVLALLPNQIDIEGDTDNVPIHGGPFQNNWALSAMRAVAVVNDLINYHGLDPGRLQATGNGDTRPLVPNDSAEHRAENRRVEIVIFATSDTNP